MKVKRLKMTSFRGISDLTLEFDTDEPTVLIGINGVGKSSVLDCLAILLSNFLELLVFLTPSSRLLKTKEDAKKGRKYLIKNTNKHDITNEYQETRNEITISLQQSREVKWYFSKVQEGQIKFDREELEVVAQDIRSQLKDNPKANLPLAVYYPVNRAVLDVSLEANQNYSFKSRDAYIEALTGEQMGFGSFFQWFRALEDLENEERRDNRDYRNRFLEAVRRGIYSLMPDFSNLRVRRSPLRMTVTKQGQELIVNQLSDGEKCLLAMVGDLARRLAIANPGLPNPLQGEGVVLIDEIELHLHPKWQREIIPALTRTFPNCQFIVTTHSPQVISEVKPNGIYILEATSEGVVAKRPESSYGRDSNRILEDLMGVPARPQEFKDDLLELFRLIDKGDLDGARQLRQQIADEIGADEPELVKASVSIRRKEILSR
ncbi:AAA family ATPase [Trichocoleus sp. FACHB-90]|uniref:AAA family ATPase n=1 Tax=Cyanophyceae TaxID=3028117 RepID=UPI001683CF28|nr:AAA family ATPase [Trichocoleus sp. FACHB-90]MBD1927298.1 AAA family ATPase [Trichocoleus sp. FACHB-90]